MKSREDLIKLFHSVYEEYLKIPKDNKNLVRVLQERKDLSPYSEQPVDLGEAIQAIIKKLKTDENLYQKQLKGDVSLIINDLLKLDIDCSELVSIFQSDFLLKQYLSFSEKKEEKKEHSVTSTPTTTDNYAFLKELIEEQRRNLKTQDQQLIKNWDKIFKNLSDLEKRIVKDNKDNKKLYEDLENYCHEAIVRYESIHSNDKNIVVELTILKILREQAHYMATYPDRQ